MLLFGAGSLLVLVDSAADVLESVLSCFSVPAKVLMFAVSRILSVLVAIFILL